MRYGLRMPRRSRSGTGSTAMATACSSRAGLDRRSVLQILGALAAAPLFAQTAAPVLTRRIPSSGETIPVVDLGSWITFNVGDDAAARDQCTAVVRAFLQSGGTLIDSSPMYGSAQETIGYALAKLGRSKVLAADKVWTSSRGAEQIEETRRHWGIDRFDLLQVHNLLAWEEHLPILFAMKKAGRLRYV